ncbi:molecular chaperone [Solibacillus silvestris]|uniref:molecular chaperone n=1 Tax=Solibacillus silvestris TaxID=76853 RepID=UPI003F7E7FA5
MNLAFLKIDEIFEHIEYKTIQIPAGGIQFKHENETIASAEPIEIKMTHTGDFMNVVRYVPFAVYLDQSLEAAQLIGVSIFSIVAHEDVQCAIYSELPKRCKVVPLFKPMDEHALFAQEYGAAYGQLLGV